MATYPYSRRHMVYGYSMLFHQLTISALQKVAEAGLQSHNGRQLQSHVGKGGMLIPTLPVDPVTAKYGCHDQGNQLLEWQLGRPRSRSNTIQPSVIICWRVASRSLMITIQSGVPGSWQLSPGAGFKHTQPPTTLVVWRFFYRTIYSHRNDRNSWLMHDHN